MKTRVYPTSRKLFGLLGDVTIITLTYILLTYLIIPPSAWEVHQALYSGMLPIAVIFTVEVDNGMGSCATTCKVI